MIRPSLMPYLWMLMGAASFATMGALIHALHGTLHWAVVAVVRTVLTALFALLLAWSRGARPVVWGPISLWVRSFAGSAALVGVFYSLPRLPLGDTLTLTNMYPLWVTLLSWPVVRQRPSAGVWAAVACSLVGVVLLQQPHLAAGDPTVLVALGSSMASAVALLGLHRLHHIDPGAVVAHFSAVATAVLLGILAAFPPPRWTPASGELLPWLMLIGVGLSATAGQVLLTKAFAAGPPARVSVVGLTQVGFGMIFDMMFWGRRPDGLALLGVVLVTGPTAWLMLRARPSPDAGHALEPFDALADAP